MMPPNRHDAAPTARRGGDLHQQKLAAPRASVGKLQVALTDQSSAFLRVAEQALGLQVGDTKLRAVQHSVA